MKKIDISYNKKLKLMNPFILQVNLQEENQNLDILIQQMESAIRAKGGQPIGPVIQYTEVIVGEDGEGEINLKLIRQADKYINHVDAPYKMETIIEVTGCMYARYQGPEEKLSLAYQKLNVIAFEEEITTKNSNYTIFVDGDEEGNITADIFIEKA